MADHTSTDSHPLIEFRQAVDWRDLTGLLIVEPDLESWMPTDQAEGQAALILEEMDETFEAHVHLYPLIWVGAVDDKEGLFAMESRPTPIHLHGFIAEDSDVWAFLRDLLSGIAQREPHAVFGLIGATREDEVQRVAEAVAGCGLRAVVLEPLCLSSALFVNLDETIASMDRERRARRVLTGEDISPLDDLLGGLGEGETD